MSNGYEDLLQKLKFSLGEDWSASGGAASDAIQSAESGLGLQFPPSYREFLRSLGEGYFFGIEIFGIGNDESVLTASLNARSNGSIPVNAVLIAIDELGDPLGFVPEGSQDHECPILRWRDFTVEEEVAISFADYLLSLAAEIGVEDANPGIGAPLFNPPFGYQIIKDRIVPDRKEVKVAGLIVERIKYRGASWNSLLKELNSRSIPARYFDLWSEAAVKEVYETWEGKY